jgi:hypothetical protein
MRWCRPAYPDLFPGPDELTSGMEPRRWRKLRPTVAEKQGRGMSVRRVTLTALGALDI